MFGYFVIYRVVFCNDTFTFMVMRRLLAVQTRETRPTIFRTPKSERSSRRGSSVEGE